MRINAFSGKDVKRKLALQEERQENLIIKLVIFLMQSLMQNSIGRNL